MAALACPACAPLLDAQAGYVSSIAPKSGRMGGSLQVGLSVGHCEGGLLASRRCPPVAPGLGGVLRGRFTADVQQVSLVPHAFLISTSNHGGKGRAYLRAGASLVHLGSVDGSFAGGMGSPSAEVGVTIPVADEANNVVHVLLSGFAEYDVRFTDQKNEAFFGFGAGLGIVE